jgi:hypothetical protein
MMGKKSSGKYDLEEIQKFETEHNVLKKTCINLNHFLVCCTISLESKNCTHFKTKSLLRRFGGTVPDIILF